ncbi:hypothetical protein [Nocardioides albus]|uniref:Uncharacterized protein n=1 Tax=Nocardioides albus TaxID=1841 RepID=A0A7W5F7W4_9ACTN|nr:hypothetical protein [Nocardioides albus]MBB3088553.1 hypothetical protein [Nocardioides albus]GGU17102.1 hypothetical protein GCM10007979_14440 [Nocardioides albus]
MTNGATDMWQWLYATYAAEEANARLLRPRPADSIDTGQQAFTDAWHSRLHAITGLSRREEKARDFVAYYFLQPSRTMKSATESYGIKRDTGAGYMKVAMSKGWVAAGETPMQVGERTPGRIYRRVLFWSDSFWEDAASPAA